MIVLFPRNPPKSGILGHKERRLTRERGSGINTTLYAGHHPHASIASNSNRCKDTIVADSACATEVLQAGVSMFHGPLSSCASSIQACLWSRLNFMHFEPWIRCPLRWRTNTAWRIPPTTTEAALRAAGYLNSDGLENTMVAASDTSSNVCCRDASMAAKRPR